MDFPRPFPSILSPPPGPSAPSPCREGVAEMCQGRCLRREGGKWSSGCNRELFMVEPRTNFVFPQRLFYWCGFPNTVSSQHPNAKKELLSVLEMEWLQLLEKHTVISLSFSFCRRLMKGSWGGEGLVRRTTHWVSPHPQALQFSKGKAALSNVNN